MNLNFKLLIPLVLIVVICGLIKYSVYAHNKISDLESDISDYEKAYEEVSKARIHYEEISKSQEDYYLNILNKLNKSKLSGVYKCPASKQEDDTSELTCYRQDELLGRLQQSMAIVRRCQQEVNKCNELRELIKGESK